MTLGPRLDLRQSQSLVMTPQLQQAIKLLALSNLEVEAFVGEAIAANPLLEVDEAPPAARAIEAAANSGEGDDHRRTHLESSPVDMLIGEGRAADDRPLDIDNTALDTDHDTGDTDFVADSAPAHNDPFDGEARLAGSGLAPDIDDAGEDEATLAQHLHAQIGAEAALDHANARVTFLARLIIDQLDEAGYLPTPLIELAGELGAPLADIEAALALVQTLDPTGVGARNLAECIALQAKEADRYDPAMAQLIGNLEMVARGDFLRLRRLCGVDEEDFAEMLSELRAYDPKPGLRFGGGAAAPVTPDILVQPAPPDKNGEGGWQVALNAANLPRLIVNRAYYLELKSNCDAKTAKDWLSEKLTDANWLVKALDQRARTILKVASELVRQQEGFFRHGVSHLKPLTLRAVADAVGLHESTVSRVTANKFLNSPRGTFELKYFFSSGVGAADGEGGASAQAVKAAIRTLIDAEEPHAILSDDTLVEMLHAKGFDLARRTVAKYREAIGLGSSVQRRRQKSLGASRR